MEEGVRRLLSIEKADGGMGEVRILGRTVLRYPRNRAYARRFEGLGESELRDVLKWQFREWGNAYELDLDEPRTFNEKLNWLKLNYRDPLVTQCADKVGVRDYIRANAGESYLMPALGVYESPDDIDFDALPGRFVAKVNWGSGQNVICSDRARFDAEDCRRRLRRWMRPEANHYFNHFEWGYKDIRPRILVEDFVESHDGLPDYKFHCFNGVPKVVLLVENRSLGPDGKRMTFFDGEFRKLPLLRRCRRNEGAVERPRQWAEMMRVAGLLAKPFPFVRVDFYILGDGTVKVGELTFCPGAGVEPFEPPEWDLKLGEMLSLPEGRS